MSTQSPPAPPAVVPPKDQTEAGNYFVANYPPFSFWTLEACKDALEQLEQPAPADRPMGIYFHIPFCRKRCHFCYFRVYTDKNSDDIKKYLDAGIAEMERVAGKPYIAGRKPQFIYFGGGTPSYLSVPQLERLTGKMKELFPWDEAQEVAFEAEPGTLTEKKLDAIRALGVTRLSLGVENFDDHILEINGRAHRSGEIEKSYNHARSIGFPQINIDLIAGMVEETEENWQRCIQKALAMEPDCLTIYQMEIPYNTTIYKEMKAAGKLVAPVADWPTKRRWVSEAFDRCLTAGYQISSGNELVKSRNTDRFVYRDNLFRGTDLLAAGVSSFGHIQGMHYQNLDRIEDYQKVVLEEGRLPINRALRPTAHQRLIREFVLQMKEGHVDAETLTRKFGVDVLTEFADPLRNQQAAGYLVVEEGEVRLTRKGLLQVDSLLPEYFEPQHRQVRYT